MLALRTEVTAHQGFGGEIGPYVESAVQQLSGWTLIEWIGHEDAPPRCTCPRVTTLVVSPLVVQKEFFECIHRPLLLTAVAHPQSGDERSQPKGACQVDVATGTAWPAAALPGGSSRPIAVVRALSAGVYGAADADEGLRTANLR